jgi:hypothetical protein
VVMVMVVVAVSTITITQTNYSKRYIVLQICGASRWWSRPHNDVNYFLKNPLKSIKIPTVSSILTVQLLHV